MSELINKKEALNLLRKRSQQLVGIYGDLGGAVSGAARLIDELPSADRPQGYWIKTDVATYRCSECGKKQIADDINELNFCCCCGSRNKIRMKGADDEYERAVEQMEYDMLYEPTYNLEDGSM